MVLEASGQLVFVPGIIIASRKRKEVLRRNQHKVDICVHQVDCADQFADAEIGSN